MRDAETQNMRVLNHLQMMGRITSACIVYDLRIMRPSGRIWDLKNGVYDGKRYLIDTVNSIDQETKKHICTYIYRGIAA